MGINILVRTLATVALFGFFSMPLGEGALIFGMVYNFILHDLSYLQYVAEDGSYILKRA